MPACNLENNRCTSEFGKNELDKNFNNYEQVYNSLSEQKKKDFYPFHIAGLIFIKGDDHFVECKDKSETSEGDNCQGEISLNSEFHTFYFGYQVGKMWDPTKFPYGVDIPKVKMQGHRKIKVYKHGIKKKLLWKELEQSWRIRKMTGTTLNLIGTGIVGKLGLTQAKKKFRKGNNNK